MRIETELSCPVHDSFRVRQVAGMFDLPLTAESRREVVAELPDEDEDWRIGVIVGPSGSGKSTAAAAAFGDAVYRCGGWPRNKAVIDGFGDLAIKRITHLLTSVGLGSPPAWIKPYSVLSTGEKFRCDLARALCSGGKLVVFDEYSSVVDRTVARIGSAALAKTLRRKRSGGEFPRFVAVTCHYDVIPWLAADWVLDMATGALSRGRLRRPSIALEVFRCRRHIWRLFAPHHYLSNRLNKAARCYLASYEGEPAAFCALLNAVGKRGVWRISRMVVLPDYQGLGAGGRMCAAVSEMNRQSGLRTTITTGHPAMIRHLNDARHWKITAVRKSGSRWGKFAQRKNVRATSLGRSVVAAEYVGSR